MGDGLYAINTQLLSNTSVELEPSIEDLIMDKVLPTKRIPIAGTLPGSTKVGCRLSVNC